jgi:hypothetical protein
MQRMTLLCIVLYLVFKSAIAMDDVSITDEPWKIYPSECSYDHCVEVDFQKVPHSMEGTGADSDFSSKFLLEAQEGPEEGSDTCTKLIHLPLNVSLPNKMSV